MDALRRGETALSERSTTTLTLAVALGQAARTATSTQRLPGDSPLSTEDLVAKLDEWLGAAGGEMSMSDLADKALVELGVTPSRLERALAALWQRPEGPRFKPGFGGAATQAGAESVAVLADSGLSWQTVAPGALLAGQQYPVRTLERAR
jgi:hypothetical protein